MRIEVGHNSSTGKSDASALNDRRSSSRLLSIRNDEGVHRARLIGGNLRSLDTQKLRAEILGLQTRGNHPGVMLTMRGVDALSSSCLGAIAELTSELERVGGILVLYALPREIARVLRKTKLDRVIHTTKTRAQARKRVLAARKKHAERGALRAA